MSEIMVLGAGMVGIGTALELQSRGHDVTVIDRKMPGQETSFGNAGLIQSEAAEPYTMPRALPEIFRILLGRTNDVIMTPRGILSQMPALWQYYRNSASRRHRALSRTNAELIRTACADHGRWIDAAGAGDLIARDGYMSVYQDHRGLQAMARDLDRLHDLYGVAAKALDGKAIRQMEPAFAAAPAGGVLWQDVWSCSDPGGLVARYADLFKRQGGRILTGDAASLRHDRQGWLVDADGRDARAEHAVIALGPWSPTLLARLGYRVRMIMKHGAHRMYSVGVRLKRPVFHAEYGVVLSSMRAGLRMTCGVALEGPGREPDTRQLLRAAQGLRGVIDLGAALPGEPWRGTRPFLPDMLPLVGRAPRHDRLWFHFGHGHQGFTLGPTTARHLANMIDGNAHEFVHPLMPTNRSNILS